MFVCLLVGLLIYLLYLFIYSFIYLFVYLFVGLFVCLFVCLCVCVFGFVCFGLLAPDSIQCSCRPSYNQLSLFCLVHLNFCACLLEELPKMKGDLTKYVEG